MKTPATCRFMPRLSPLIVDAACAQQLPLLDEAELLRIDWRGECRATPSRRHFIASSATRSPPFYLRRRRDIASPAARRHARQRAGGWAPRPLDAIASIPPSLFAAYYQMTAYIGVDAIMNAPPSLSRMLISRCFAVALDDFFADDAATSRRILYCRNVARSAA